MGKQIKQIKTPKMIKTPKKSKGGSNDSKKKIKIIIKKK